MAVFDRSEPVGTVRTVLQRSEVRFGKRIVVGHVRPAVRLDDAEIGQQQRDRLAAHHAATVRMERQLAWFDALLRTGFRDEPLGEHRALVGRDHPADHIAAEDIQLCGAPHNSTHVERLVTRSRASMSGPPTPTR